jgi:hypothetical protein
MFPTAMKRERNREEEGEEERKGEGEGKRPRRWRLVRAELQSMIGGVTLKRRCTYRPSVIYLIVNKLFSLTHSLVANLATPVREIGSP